MIPIVAALMKAGLGLLGSAVLSKRPAKSS